MSVDRLTAALAGRCRLEREPDQGAMTTADFGGGAER